jgi:nitroimidazol reductase NimA-like FMN-containing flavoprotein (pyridoxamine 5'-phosphate oxidase superfamily)/ribosomal protein S18 acetylase RimI-like enzyme
MKAVHRMPREEAVALLARAPFVHVASTDLGGRPLLRTVHAVVDGDHLAFHGSPAGEKTQATGRPAFIVAEETVATMPSYFIDAERACPATTYYLSAHVEGNLEPVEDTDVKARVLGALMRKLQPEGGYVPIEAAHALYAPALRSILVLRVALERVVGKAKLGQHRSVEDLGRVVEGLWRRGAPGDDRAIEQILAANPRVPTPAWLAGPGGTRLVCALGEPDVGPAAALVAGEYWNAGVPEERLASAMRASTALVGARDGEGHLIATARALSDGVRSAWVGDVCVARAWRGRGLGQAVVGLLLDHPRVRAVDRVRLNTRDAQTLYERYGFVETAKEVRPYPSAEMVLRR